MPGAKKLTQYLEKKDKYGVKVGTWALPHRPGIARCRHCHSEHCFEKGVVKLTNHSETVKHRKNGRSPFWQNWVH